MPACERAALEVAQAQAGLQLAVVVLDSPADLGQPDEFFDGGIFGQGGQPVAGGLIGFGRPFGQQPAAWQAAVVFAGMSRLAGRTRMATKWLVMAASGLPLVALVPCRQVTGWI